MNLELKTDYWDNPALKQQFQRFLIDIFGLDLSRWDQLGYWDNNYRPFSFFDGDTLVSSLCLYTMDMVVLGKSCKIGQFSAVGTLPEYRRKGLNADLTRRALDWARGTHDFFFLFADTDAQAFYKYCGFRKTEEKKATISITGRKPVGEVVKLDLENDDHRDLIFKFGQNRAPVSNTLGILNARLLMFWCLYFLKENIYYSPEQEIIILLGRNDGVVTVFDIIGKTIPSFSEIYPFIADPSDTSVEFRFMVDQMALTQDISFTPFAESGAHLMGTFPLEKTPYIFPQTCRA